MEIMPLTKDNFQAAVEVAAKAIHRGGLVVAPTDTVYGILANATDKQAIERVFIAKSRPNDKYLPIFVKNMVMAKKLAKISLAQEKFLEEKWPGKFTARLNRKEGTKLFGVEKNTIALRIPFYPFINSLLEVLNLPLCGTSANISGKPASGKINYVLAQFTTNNILPDLAINAGDLPPSKPSTIVDLTQSPPQIIR